MIKVSVIVPTYNYGHLLPRCLDHLVNQSLKDIEIIIVDDCSTDNTTEVVKPYLKDSRVKYVRNEVNQKLYASRIVGMKIAQGTYIAHCDADDYYEYRAFELMYNKAISVNADIVTCNSVENKNNIATTYSKNRSFQGESVFLAFLSRFISHVIWRTLYHKDIIKKYLAVAPNIHITAAEDALANFILYFYSQRWEHIKIPLYNYSKNPHSHTENVKANYQALLNNSEICIQEVLNFAQSQGFYTQYEYKILNWVSDIAGYCFTHFIEALPETYAEEWQKQASPLCQRLATHDIGQYILGNKIRRIGIKREFFHLVQAVQYKFFRG